jgi:hypothetical protein
VQRDAVLRKAGGVDQRTGGVVHVLVEQVHQRALVVRLEYHELGFELARERLQLVVDLAEAHGAVDMRLAAAEKVQVGAVQDEDFHLVLSVTFSVPRSSASRGWQ